MEAGMPESFNVLVKEIRSLGINIELDQRESNESHAANEITPLGGVNMKDLLKLFKQQSASRISTRSASGSPRRR
jgi:hypothetical protein